MVYQAHDPLGEEEEDDKNYHRGGEDNPLDYHKKEGEDSYSSKTSDVYDSGEQNEDLKKEEDDKETIEESLGLSEDDPKYEKDKEESDSVVAVAANEVFQEGQQPESKKEQKNAKKSIEDAINKAIKEEKEVLHLD